MNNKCLVLIVALLWISSANLRKIVINTELEGYYWRNLIGDIPKDALPGGIDSTGDVTYIGQTVHYGGTGSLLTGPYIPKEKKMYYEYGSRELTVDKWIKLLCSQEPENFVWISVKNGETTDRGKNLSYVHGGEDTGRSLAIGRIKIGNEVTVGKVLVVNDLFNNLFYNWKGAGTSTAQYEALFYDKCNENGSSSKTPVTVIVY